MWILYFLSDDRGTQKGFWSKHIGAARRGRYQFNQIHTAVAALVADFDKLWRRMCACVGEWARVRVYTCACFGFGWAAHWWVVVGWMPTCVPGCTYDASRKHAYARKQHCNHAHAQTHPPTQSCTRSVGAHATTLSTRSTQRPTHPHSLVRSHPPTHPPTHPHARARAHTPAHAHAPAAVSWTSAKERRLSTTIFGCGATAARLPIPSAATDVQVRKPRCSYPRGPTKWKGLSALRPTTHKVAGASVSGLYLL